MAGAVMVLAIIYILLLQIINIYDIISMHTYTVQNSILGTGYGWSSFICPGSSPGLLLCNQAHKCIASCDTIHSKPVVLLVLPHRCLQSTAEAARALYTIWVVAFEHEQDL